MILRLATGTVLAEGVPRLDTFLGYDFRYLYIGKLLDRVSQANLIRPGDAQPW